jgi:hypothetical protein
MVLRQILSGEQVLGWVWNSPLLGENFEEIRRFLQETCEQLGMAGSNARMPIMSKANTIDLTTNRTAKELGLYDIVLCQAVGILAQGVQQQRDIADFDSGWRKGRLNA